MFMHLNESNSTFPSARPSMMLPEKTVLTEGEEKTIQCDIIGYYPDKLTVAWHIQNGSRTVQAGGSHLFHVCNEMAIHNPDDTYSIRSGIRLNLSAVKKGELRLICQVEHQPNSWTYNRAVALTVQGRIVFFFHCYTQMYISMSCWSLFSLQLQSLVTVLSQL